MKSRIAEAIKLAGSPVVILFSHERPEGALQFKEGHWGCVMAMLNAAAGGRVSALDSKSGCGGGRIGMGFCSSYEHIAGGIEYFLSTGRGEGYPEGERYIKTPEAARCFAEGLPKVEIPYEYILFKALPQVNLEAETPEAVVFVVNPDQLSALVVLANYGRNTSDNAIIPFASGCQSIGILVYDQAKQPQPKAVVGAIDISARPFMKPDQLTFAMPFTMYQEMEANVDGSFLGTKAWMKVRDRIPTAEK